MVNLFIASALVLLLLLYGCPQKTESKTSFELTYLSIDSNGQRTEGPVGDAVSFSRSLTYFHIRANITNTDNVTHHLNVLDQSYDAYQMRLPLYSVETLNGAKRNWADITGLAGGTASLVPFEPGKTKALEQPIYFFNQQVSSSMPGQLQLTVSIVNGSGTVLGTKTVSITITD